MSSLHPGLVRALQEQHAASNISPVTLAERRAAHEDQVSRFTPTSERAHVGNVEDIDIDAGARTIPVRVYHPLGEEWEDTNAAPRPLLPAVVWLHGGGWTTGSLETADVLAREVCAAGAIVVSVDYRLAPEHPFPAALDDSATVLDWVADHAGVLGADAGRIAVGGDSAGGNLAAVTSLHARQRGRPCAAQLVLYPVTDIDPHARHHSRTTHAQGPLLTTADLEWLIGQYLGPSEVDVRSPALSPLWSPHLANAAPAVVVTAQFDPLCSEGQAYARRLQDAGVPVVSHLGESLMHGSFDMLGICPPARALVQRAAADLLDLTRLHPHRR